VPRPFLGVSGNPFAQFEVSRHGSVLVVSISHGLMDQLLKYFGRVEIRKSLAHIQCPMLLSKGAHFGENGGAYVGQFGFPVGHGPI
jgi:hypothetical protein